jgi:hypothetical protein
MVEYVGKRLLFLGLFIYIRCYTFHGTVKGFGSRCLNHTAHFFVMLSYYVSLHSEFHVMMSVTISAYKLCLYEDSCLSYIRCLCMQIVLLNSYCVVFLLCLSSFCVSCTQGCQFLLFVHFWKKDIYMFSQRD